MMDANRAVNLIKLKFEGRDDVVLVPAPDEGFFSARLIDEGVEVDSLQGQPFLPWEVFIETINLLNRKGGRAERGDALEYNLGEDGLSLHSVEGHIAHVVYGKQLGDRVFRRIAPVAGILIWAGICESAPGELVLHER
jgi:hypothetical protein